MFPVTGNIRGVQNPYILILFRRFSKSDDCKVNGTDFHSVKYLLFIPQLGSREHTHRHMTVCLFLYKPCKLLCPQAVWMVNGHDMGQLQLSMIIIP